MYFHDDRQPLTVVTRQLDGVLIYNGCNRWTSHTYDGYGAFIDVHTLDMTWFFILHLLKFPAIYRSSESFIVPKGGMTITISIKVTQEVDEWTPTRYRCLFRDCWDRLKGNHAKSSPRSIGWSFTGLFKCDSFADELSVDPASDGSRSNRLNGIFMRRKLQAFLATNGTRCRNFTWGKKCVLWCAYNVTSDWPLASINSQTVRTHIPIGGWCTFSFTASTLVPKVVARNAWGYIL